MEGRAARAVMLQEHVSNLGYRCSGCQCTSSARHPGQRYPTLPFQTISISRPSPLQVCTPRQTSLQDAMLVVKHLSITQPLFSLSPSSCCLGGETKAEEISFSFPSGMEICPLIANMISKLHRISLSTQLTSKRVVCFGLV